MLAADQPTIYDELLAILAQSADQERLLAFRLPPAAQRRLEKLLELNSAGTITAEESAELDEFERLEHFGRMLKARLRQESAR